MSAALFAAVVGIALLDSLNPSLFVAQFYLLTTPHPVPRILAYIAGVVVANLCGGLLVLAGLRRFLVGVLDTVPAGVVHGVLLAVGLAILAFGLWYGAGREPDTAVRTPRSLTPISTFALGLAVMLNELTTALPYFVAIERIAQAGLGALGNVLALGVYNLVFAAPLLAFLGLFVLFRERFTGRLHAVNAWLRRWVPRVVKYGSVGFGGALAAYAAAALTLG